MKKILHFGIQSGDVMCILSPVACPGGSAVGDSEKSTSNELRQAQPLPEVLLREGNHAEGKGDNPPT